jgi:hypothetical protein
MLDDEQRQGFPYTAAAVGDGSWDKRSGEVSRATLLHDGTVLGGRIENPFWAGSTLTNYDGELLHSVDTLAKLRNSRLLYIFDSTSPVVAAEAFRRANTAVRSRVQCSRWLGWHTTFEQQQDVIVYWWSGGAGRTEDTCQRLR